jgi:hypothetical protein
VRTFVQILVLELDETEGNPEKWDWTSIIDTPGSVSALHTVEVEPDPSDEQVDLLARLSTDYRDAVRREIGVIEEVRP